MCVVGKSFNLTVNIDDGHTLNEPNEQERKSTKGDVEQIEEIETALREHNCITLVRERDTVEELTQIVIKQAF